MAGLRSPALESIIGNFWGDWGRTLTLYIFLRVGDLRSMPRAPREDYPGAVHHVMSRGARRAPIFKADDHCLLFLECLDDAVYRHGLEVLAYSLMPNHFHLLVRCPESRAVLSGTLRHLLSSYSLQVNRRHRWDHSG
jgi:REP element-mobilizing transposase RayT